MPFGPLDIGTNRVIGNGHAPCALDNGEALRYADMSHVLADLFPEHTAYRALPEQISRLLDERIKSIANNVNEYEPEFAEINEAFIVGFHSSNVSNFVGLTTNIELYNAGQQILGLVFFKSAPTNDQISDRLLTTKERNQEFGSFKTDKNEHLFLVYTYDSDSKLVTKRIFDLTEGSFLSEQPKLSVLDAEKLYNHSALVRVSFPIKLDILDGTGNVVNKSKLEETFTNLGKSLNSESKKLKLHLCGSNYSTKSFVGDKNLTETLYDHLDPPKDVEQMGDYLPQLTKEDKKKLVDKWRNKIKAQHAPLEIELEHEDYSYNDSDQSEDCYKLKLNLFMYLHMTDPIFKSLQSILYNLGKMMCLSCHSLRQKQLNGRPGLGIDELKVCNFRPRSLGHLVPASYVIPSESKSAADFKYLRDLRKELHLAYLLPLDRPQFRYSQRISGVCMKNSDEQTGLLCNVHKDILDKSGIKGGTRQTVEGTYTYHHYMQDRLNDNGWGCAYRSLQTIISWFKHQGYIYSPDVALRLGDKADQLEPLRKLLAKESRVPNHEEIQKTLVDVGDKQPSFIGSQKWIGSQEVCYVLNHLFNLDSKFISVSSGSELASKARELGQHFALQSTPIMIGGGVLAHTIIGSDYNEKNGDISYLILDPHYTGAEDLATILKKGWCGWKKNNFWDKNSFYNLCLPQRPAEI